MMDDGKDQEVERLFGRRGCQNSQPRRGWNPTPSRRQKLGIALLWKPLQHQIQCQTPSGKTMEQTLALAQTDLDLFCYGCVIWGRLSHLAGSQQLCL